MSLLDTYGVILEFVQIIIQHPDVLCAGPPLHMQPQMQHSVNSAERLLCGILSKRISDGTWPVLVLSTPSSHSLMRAAQDIFETMVIFSQISDDL